MDELEFRKRVYANPAAIDQEILDAAKDHAALQKILADSRKLEHAIVNLTNSIAVTAGLAERLLTIPAQAETSASGREASKPSSNNFFQYYAIAASLLMAVGIAAILTLGGAPSTAEIAFGGQVIQHLYHEVNEINAFNAGSDLPNISMPAVIEVTALADTQFNDEQSLQAMPVRFAKLCVVLPTFHSAHVMVNGSHGAINVIVINNSPVSTEYAIQDDRFRGLVVPLDDGNLILIGEQDENLEELKSMFAQNVEWAI